MPNEVGPTSALPVYAAPAELCQKLAVIGQAPSVPHTLDKSDDAVSRPFFERAADREAGGDRRDAQLGAECTAKLGA